MLLLAGRGGEERCVECELSFLTKGDDKGRSIVEAKLSCWAGGGGGGGGGGAPINFEEASSCNGD